MNSTLVLDHELRGVREVFAYPEESKREGRQEEAKRYVVIDDLRLSCDNGKDEDFYPVHTTISE